MQASTLPNEIESPCTGTLIRRVVNYVETYNGPQYEALGALGMTWQSYDRWRRDGRVPVGRRLDKIMRHLDLVIVDRSSLAR